MKREEINPLFRVHVHTSSHERTRKRVHWEEDIKDGDDVEKNKRKYRSGEEGERDSNDGKKKVRMEGDERDEWGEERNNERAEGDDNGGGNAMRTEKEA